MFLLTKISGIDLSFYFFKSVHIGKYAPPPSEEISTEIIWGKNLERGQDEKKIEERGSKKGKINAKKAKIKDKMHEQ